MPRHEKTVENETVPQLTRITPRHPFARHELAYGIKKKDAKHATRDWIHTDHYKFWEIKPAHR
jgi:hypothetical protein